MAEPPEPEIRADLHLEIEESLSNISKGGTKALVEYRDIVTTIKFFLDTNEVSLEENVSDALYFLEETQKALDNTKGATSTSSVNKSCQVDNIKEACSVPSRSCKEEISRVQLKEPNILFEDFRGMIEIDNLFSQIQYFVVAGMADIKEDIDSFIRSNFVYQASTLKKPTCVMFFGPAGECYY